MTYMEAWKMMASNLPADTDELREAYVRLFMAVKVASEKEERCGKAGKTDQKQ